MDNVEMNVPEVLAEQKTLLFRQMVGRTRLAAVLRNVRSGTTFGKVVFL